MIPERNIKTVYKVESSGFPFCFMEASWWDIYDAITAEAIPILALFCLDVLGDSIRYGFSIIVVYLYVTIHVEVRGYVNGHHPHSFMEARNLKTSNQVFGFFFPGINKPRMNTTFGKRGTAPFWSTVIVGRKSAVASLVVIRHLSHVVNSIISL